MIRNTKVVYVMERDYSLPVTVPRVVPFSYRRKQPGNNQNGGTVLPIANLMEDSQLGSPDSYSSFLVTTHPSRMVLEIFTCDRQPAGWTDRQHSPLL